MKKLLSRIRRKKIEREIEIEMLETLCTICLYLADDSKHSPILRGKYYPHFCSHFRNLKEYSYSLRGIDDPSVASIERNEWRV